MLPIALLLVAPLVIPLAGVPVFATDLPEEIATFEETVDGETLRLADGREVRLDGIRVPGNEAPGGLAARAQAAVARRAGKGPLILIFDQRRRNRHGQLLAQVYVRPPGAPEIWLQQILVSAGLARVGGLPENRRAVPALLAAEAEARAARRGLWAFRRFAVLTPEQAAGRIGSFQLVEGNIVSAKTIRGRTYLNFGADWRQDFTVTLDRAAGRRFKAGGIDPLSLEGRRVRVRGWLKSFNGPMIELGYPERLELLDPSGSG